MTCKWARGFLSRLQSATEGPWAPWSGLEGRMEGPGVCAGLVARKAPQSPGEGSDLSCSRTCFLAGALAGGGWVMATPKDQANGCALERPPQAWTMLGAARPGGGSLSHEVCLKDRAPGLLSTRLLGRGGAPDPGGLLPSSSSCFHRGRGVWGGLSSPRNGVVHHSKARLCTGDPGWLAVLGQKKGKMRAKIMGEDGREFRRCREGRRGCPGPPRTGVHSRAPGRGP